MTFEPYFGSVKIEERNRILLTLLRNMLLIRLFEEKVSKLIQAGEINCPCHLYTGQEAIATGICASLNDEDYVFSNHRSHGHYIAKTREIAKLMAELFGKVTGCSHGRGGSMHLSAPNKGFPGSSAIVGGTIPLAVGAALSFKKLLSNNVSVVFFGDGASNEGVFYESLNFAALFQLPVIFVCENNLYATHMKIERCLSNPIIYKTAESFNIPSVRIDGNNVLEIFKAGSEAITRARSLEGPSFIECMTYRWCGHVGPHQDFDKGLRSYDEFNEWKKKCPIDSFYNLLFKNKIITGKEYNDIIHSINIEIENSIVYSKESDYPTN